MEFETVNRRGRIYVTVNGVEAAGFAIQGAGGCVIYMPRPMQSIETMKEALNILAASMGDWYTVAQAAERLVELGAYDSPPSAHTLANLARARAFPGAFKLLGKGSGGGQRGSWRIPEAGLQEFAERRKG